MVASIRQPTPPLWVHAIRRVEPAGRVRVAEPGGVDVRFDAHLDGGRWRLLPAGTVDVGVGVDARGRVLLPRGVAYQLGLQGAVVVSVRPADGAVVLWSPAELDELVGER